MEIRLKDNETIDIHTMEESSGNHVWIYAKMNCFIFTGSKVTIEAGEGCFIKVKDNCDIVCNGEKVKIDGGKDSRIRGKDKSDIWVGENSIVKVGDESTVIAGAGSIVSAGEKSYLTGNINTKLSAGKGSVLKWLSPLGDLHRKEIGKEEAGKTYSLQKTQDGFEISNME